MIFPACRGAWQRCRLLTAPLHRATCKLADPVVAFVGLAPLFTELVADVRDELEFRNETCHLRLAEHKMSAEAVSVVPGVSDAGSVAGRFGGSGLS